jgi:hypothetical protein
MVDLMNGPMRVGGSAAVGPVAVDCWGHVEVGVTFAVIPRSAGERAELRTVIRDAGLQEQKERRVLIERLFAGPVGR